MKPTNAKGVGLKLKIIHTRDGNRTHNENNMRRARAQQREKSRN